VALPHVHFVNRFFYPDLSATSQMLSGIAFGLAAEGHDVQIASSRQLYEDASAELAPTETANGVTIHRVATTRFGRAGLGGRAVDYASFYAATAWHLLRHVRRGDIIVAKTDPPMLSVVTALIGRARGATCVNWLQDLFPEVASSVKLGGRGGQIAFAALRIIRNWSLQRARCNVVIGERMAEYLLAGGIAPAKIVAIPNWADPTIVFPITHSSLRREWGLEGKIVVGYSGNLGRAHEIATFVDAIADIQNRSGDAIARDIIFVFVGRGALRRAFEADIAAKSLSNVRFFP
jgi:hypothetical protein